MDRAPADERPGEVRHKMCRLVEILERPIVVLLFEADTAAKRDRRRRCWVERNGGIGIFRRPGEIVDFIPRPTAIEVSGEQPHARQLAALDRLVQVGERQVGMPRRYPDDGSVDERGAVIGVDGQREFAVRQSQVPLTHLDSSARTRLERQQHLPLGQFAAVDCLREMGDRIGVVVAPDGVIACVQVIVCCARVQPQADRDDDPER